MTEIEIFDALGLELPGDFAAHARALGGGRRSGRTTAMLVCALCRSQEHPVTVFVSSWDYAQVLRRRLEEMRAQLPNLQAHEIRLSVARNPEVLRDKTQGLDRKSVLVDHFIYENKTP